MYRMVFVWSYDFGCLFFGFLGFGVLFRGSSFSFFFLFKEVLEGNTDFFVWNGRRCFGVCILFMGGRVGGVG